MRMDQAAFRAFHQKTAPRLRAYIVQRCGSIDAADDILQEVFLKFLRARDKTEERGMRAYLYRTADSLIIDNYTLSCFSRLIPDVMPTLKKQKR